jgi:hypothetical protein
LVAAIGHRIEVGIGIAGTGGVYGLDDIALIETGRPTAWTAHRTRPYCDRIGDGGHLRRAVIWHNRIHRPVEGQEWHGMSRLAEEL